MTDNTISQISMLAVAPPGYTAPMALAAGATYASGAIANPRQSTIAVGANLSVAGTLTIQRYIDFNGTLPQGAPTPLALLAGVAAGVTVGDGNPFLSYSVTVTPANGAAATLTALAITLQPVGVYGGNASLPFVHDLMLVELRLQTMFMQSLINNTDNLANLRRDQLTELGSLATLGLGS